MTQPFKLTEGIRGVDRAITYTRIITLLQRERDEIDTPRLQELYTMKCLDLNLKPMADGTLAKILKQMEKKGLVTMTQKNGARIGSAHKKNYWKLVVKEE